MKALASQFLLALALAGLVLPPHAFAVTTVEGADGTDGYSAIPMIDASTNKLFCSQEARGAIVLLPGGSTITLNACSSSTAYSTDIGSVSPVASGIPVAGTDSKVSKDWLDTGTGTGQVVTGADPRLTDARESTNTVGATGGLVWISRTATGTDTGTVTATSAALSKNPTVSRTETLTYAYVLPNTSKTTTGTLTLTQTDIATASATAGAIPMAGTNGKLDTSWYTTVPASLLPPPLFVETVTVTGTASDSSTSTQVQLNLGINTATVSRWYSEPHPVMEILKTDGVSRTQPTAVLVLDAEGDRLVEGTFAGTGLEFRGKSTGNLSNYQQARISTFSFGANSAGLQFEVRPNALYYVSPAMMLSYNGLLIGDPTYYMGSPGGDGYQLGFVEIKPLPAPSLNNTPTLVLHSRYDATATYTAINYDISRSVTRDNAVLGGTDYLGRAYYIPSGSGKTTTSDDATLSVNPRTAASPGIVIYGATGQSADLLRASDVNGTAVAAIGFDGKVRGANLVSAAGGNVFVTGTGTATGTTTQVSLLQTAVYTVSNTSTGTTTITGTLTTGYLPKATGTTSLGNSPAYTDGTNVAIGNTTALARFDIRGASDFSTQEYGLALGKRNDADRSWRFMLGKTGDTAWGSYSLRLNPYNSGSNGDMVFGLGAGRMRIGSGQAVTADATTNFTDIMAVLNGGYVCIGSIDCAVPLAINPGKTFQVDTSGRVTGANTVVGAGGIAFVSGTTTTTTTSTGLLGTAPLTVTFTSTHMSGDVGTGRTISLAGGLAGITGTGTATGTLTSVNLAQDITITNTSTHMSGDVGTDRTIAVSSGLGIITGTGTNTATQTSGNLAQDITVTLTATHLSGDVPTDRTIAVGGGLAVITGTGTATGTQTSGSLAQNITISNTATATSAQTHLIVTPNAVKTWTDSLTLSATDFATTSPSATAIPLASTASKIDVGWLPASATPTASTIPIAGTDSKIATGWLPSMTGSYVSTSTTITFPGKTVTLSANSTVTQTDIGTATPTASKIPIADGSGKLNAWVQGRVNHLYWDNYQGSAADGSNGTYTDALSYSYTAPASGTATIAIDAILTLLGPSSSAVFTNCIARITVGGTQTGTIAYGTIAPQESGWGYVTLPMKAVFEPTANTAYTVKVQFTSGGATACTIGGAGTYGTYTITEYLN